MLGGRCVCVCVCVWGGVLSGPSAHMLPNSAVLLTLQMMCGLRPGVFNQTGLVCLIRLSKAFLSVLI